MSISWKVRKQFAPLTAVFAFAVLACCAVPAEKDKPSDESEAILKGLKLPKGFIAETYTAPKQVINPVSLAFDDANRLYVCETHRFRVGGGLDIRENMFMYFDDTLSKTPADRAALYIKYKEKFKPNYFTSGKEKIVILEDTLGKGKADKTTVFAEGFNDPVDGPGVGIAWNDGKLYYACIPKVWELTGAHGTGPADKINSLIDGFGVRVGISGHDLHGTIIGPDGKLYCTVGDRGYNLTTKEGQKLFNPHSGGVFRCNLDGSGLEQYYYGLRNPQELAFDEFGNLFTCDNNADIGDASRLTYILEGGSSGWHMGWQELGLNDFAKHAGLGGKRPDPWLDEGMWKMRSPTQSTSLLPPVGLITSGPCGMAYNPGTGLPEKYAHNLFVCDYTAGGNSGVHACLAEESGAGFVMKNPEKFVWGTTATDIAFGYDGRAYVCDYGGGWALPGKGAIIAVSDPESRKNPLVEEVRKLFANGMGKLETKELKELLKHADIRVRQRAQFELAKRGKDGLAALTDAAKTPGHTLSRVHGIWGLGQLGATEPDALKTLVSLLSDSEARVREQAAKTLGDARYSPAMETLQTLLKDDSPRVKTFAAIALGKLACKTDTAALIEILRANDDKDAFLRHAAVMALAGSGDAAGLNSFITDSSKAVRLGVLMTYRKLGDARVAEFLRDADPLIYADAVRSIYETPILGAMPRLAAELKRIVDKPDDFKALTPLLFSRIVNAAYRYGTQDSAPLLAQFASIPALPESVRIAALDFLNKWEEPTIADPVTGLPRPIAKRAKLVPDDTMREAIAKTLDENGDIAAKAADMAIAFGVTLTDTTLLTFAKNEKRGEAIRVAAIQQLAQRKNAELAALLPKMIAENNTNVRAAALGILLELDPPAGLAKAREVLASSPQVMKNETKVVTDKTAGAWDALAMGAPSSADYADKNSKNGVVVTYVKGFGKPNDFAGADGEKLPRLNDGLAAENNDDLQHNVWNEGNESRMLMDLKKSIAVGAVNTYTWHVRERSPQFFTLWGSNKEKPDPAAKDLKNDWTQIAKVDSTNLGEGDKHGSAVYNPVGEIGTYRFLLWQSFKKKQGTFYTELDVYEKGKWSFEPPEEKRMKQRVFQLLGKTTAHGATDMLGEWFDKFIASQVPPALQLDVLEAAEERKDEKLSQRIEDYKKTFKEEDKLAPYRIAMEGGDAKQGAEYFQFHAAGCLRCHKLGDVGGDAGPKINGVGARLTREKILESMIDPSAVIVPGYGTCAFKMQDGRMISGCIVEENASEVTIKDVDGKVTKLAAAEIKRRSPPTSAMPPMAPLLKTREIRDLIEFLAGLKAPPAENLKH